jgi:predicted NBD/HSP70 family sugar kinase
MLEPVHGPDFTLHDAIDAALAGDAGCRRVIADAGRHIGIALANLVNLLSPELIVVGGELAGAGDILLNPIRDAVARYAIETAASATTLVPTELGDDAEVLGAIALAVRGQEVDALAPPVGSS